MGFFEIGVSSCLAKVNVSWAVKKAHYQNIHNKSLQQRLGLTNLSS
jgi:hypothetical protein